MNPGLLGWPVGSDKGLRIRQRKYALVRDEKASGTHAGDPASTGVWYTRTLNTVVHDDIGLYLVSNQLIVPAGTYYCRLRAPVMDGGVSMIRLRDMTKVVTMATGYGGYSEGGAGFNVTYCEGRGDFTVTRDGTRMEIQQNSQSNDGTGWVLGYGGYAIAGVTEKYAMIELWRLGS